MARQRRTRQTAAARRYYEARPDIYIFSESEKRYVERVSSIPRYGRGSRGKSGPTSYNILQKGVTDIASDYDLGRGERLQLRGLTRRLNNLQKLVNTNEEISKIMEERWAQSDAKAEFGYKDFSELTTEDKIKLMDMYVSMSGVMSLPNLNTPDPDKTTVKWDS